MLQESTTNLSEAQPKNASKWLSILRHYPLFFYFLIAYAMTWGFGFTYIVFLHHHDFPFWVLIFVALGPTASSFIMTAALEGRAGIGNLLRRYVRWRVNVLWYLLVLIGIPGAFLLVCLIFPGGVAAVYQGLMLYPLTYVTTFFLGGPFLEEPGWRGFALPRLQQRFGPLRGSLLLGFLWGFWHLPLFFIPGYNGSGVGFVGISTALLAFILATSAFSVIFAWVFNNTRGSLLLTMLLHASINTSGVFSPADNASLLYQIIMYAVFIAIVVVILIFTRGRLSYDRYLREECLLLSIDPVQEKQ